MAFTILHPTDAIEDPADTFPQAQWDRKDIEIILAGFSNVGVISGCAVTAQGSPNMSVHVASGSVMVGGTTTDDVVSVSAGDVSISAAHASLPRKDFIVASDAGALSAVAGTAATTPAFPTIPADRVVLASVYVPATDTAIATNQIVDKRLPLTTPPAPSEATWQTVSLGADLAAITSQTTQQTLTGLSFSMLANTKYRIRARVFGSVAGTGGGWDANLTGPASPTFVSLLSTNPNSVSGLESAAIWWNSLPTAAGDVSVMGTGSASTDRGLWRLDGVVHNGANAGTFQLQSAQQVSDPDGLIIRAGSYIEYEIA